MSTITVNLSRAHLRAALVFSAEKDVRYYLMGVHVEVHDAKHFIVATDGSTLCAIVGQDDECKGSAVFTIPSGVLKAIKASIYPTVAVAFDPNTEMVTVKDIETVHTVKAVEGRFPDWRRVIPSAPTPGEQVVVNPALFSKAGAAAKALGKKPEAVWTHYASSAAVVQVQGAPEFVGVVMGMRAPIETGAPAFPDRSMFDRPATPKAEELV